MQLTLLDPTNPAQPFPAACKALENPNGLLAAGGCLSSVRLINAYYQGIFPWYNPGEPILWWSPNPRLVLFPNQLHISKSMTKTLRKSLFRITYDQAFSQVMRACAVPRNDSEGTWIDQEMLSAYTHLHYQGFAHSIEVWLNNRLVGGLYGVALGQVFFGESMFHTETDASKIAFINLVQKLHRWAYQLIDCQIHTAHLVSLGAQEIPRQQFIEYLKLLTILPPSTQAWKE